jgi:PAS domain S-box-containing protein
VGDLQALAAATERYRMLFERVPVGLYRYDPGGTLIECNQALLDIFIAPDVDALRAAGFPRELYVDRGDRFRWRSASAEGAASGVEYRVRRLNGDVAWVRHSAKLVRNPMGDPMWFEGVIQDVTQSRETQEALIEAESRFRALVENGSDFIMLLGPDGTLQYVSPSVAAELGHPPDELVGISILDLIHPEDVEEIRCLIGRLGEEPEGALILAARFHCAHDVWRSWEGVVTNRVQDPSIGGLILNAHNVSARLQAEDELRATLAKLHRLSDERLLGRLVAAQEEERQRLAGDIHDDPIQVMAAAAVRLDMVERATIGTAAQETLERTAETVQQAINRLRNLVFELRPPALDREGLAVAIRQYLQQLVDAGEIDVGLQDDLESEPSREIRTAAYRIAQEALTNVRKHAGATRVRVELRQHDGGVATVIADDGIGFRADGVAARSRPGHIGLQSMRERAEALGGWWRIESRPQGGTRVEFWLPDEANSAGARDD